MKLSVHCAFEEGVVGLRFVFNALTTDNSTGIRPKMKTFNTQVFDEFTAHNLSGLARTSTVKEYLAPQAQDSPSI
jgi:hypothetical protein